MNMNINSNSFLQYKEYEQIVVEDRIEKEKARRKAEQEAIELRSSIRVSVESETDTSWPDCFRHQLHKLVDMQ